MSLVTEVWSSNLMEELNNLDQAMHIHRVVSIDSEFPGLLRTTPRNALESVLYDNVKFSVDRTDFLQLGITLSDDYGCVFRTWEFNFKFDPQQDMFVAKSIDFLKQNGLNFENLGKYGIDVVEFSELFKRLLCKHRDLEWVTFHGLFDVAHLLGCVTGKILPNTVLGFTKLASCVLGDVVDMKYMARFCEGLDKGELGLQKLAGILGVERIGGAHQAGSDSLLTALVYAQMRAVYRLDKYRCQGYLYGISKKIARHIHGKKFKLKQPPNLILFHPIPPPQMAMFVNHPVVVFNYCPPIMF